jgi:hypothetical protein
MEDYSTNNYEDFLFSLIVGIMLLEVVVGVVQIVGALIRTIVCLNNKRPIGKLKTYWIVVGSYILIFAGLYYGESIILSNISINAISDSENYADWTDWYMWFVYIRIAWIILAWVIAIWYCVAIVFVKRKKIIEIDNPLNLNL